jgi:hypothetical protein
MSLSTAKEFIEKELGYSDGIELIKKTKKEAVVFDEKETSYIFTFGNPNLAIKAELIISDPLYFCSLSIIKNKENFFSLTDYLSEIESDKELVNLLDRFYDEEIEADEYTILFLKAVKRHLSKPGLLDILNGKSWPVVIGEVGED